MYHPFSVADTIKTSWHVLKKNFITLVVYAIISLIGYGLLDFIKLIFFNDDVISRALQWLVTSIVESYIALSFYQLILTLMDKEYYEFSFKDIIPSIRKVLAFILIGIAYFVLIFILWSINFFLQRMPLIQLIFEIISIIIVFYLLIRSIFCVCFVVDDDSRPFESLKQSFHITNHNFFNTVIIVAIIVATMVVTLIPIVAIVSLFNTTDGPPSLLIRLSFYTWFVIAFPIVQVLIMVAYRKLVYSHLDVDDDVAETN